MIKIFEVVECGGPGGTGEQVAAICNGLDPAEFDVSLVYVTRDISPAEDASALRKLHRLFAEHQPDVVHAHSSKAGVLARAAAKAAGIKNIFYSPHGYGFLMQDRSAASRALYRTIERAASRIGTTIAVSPGEGAQAERLGAKRVHVICDAYLGDFPELLPHEGLVAGSCGRMTHARNPDAWLLLVQRLCDSRNGVKCVWIGGGEDEGKVHEDLTNMNLLMKVSMTGWLPAEKARERLRGLDLFVHYSRWDAMPNAVLEAMALGLPVVASDVPGNRDAVQEGVTGFLVKTEVDLLERCQQLLDDEPLRRKLGAAGRERVLREFSREHMLSEISRLYAS